MMLRQDRFVLLIQMNIWKVIFKSSSSVKQYTNISEDSSQGFGSKTNQKTNFNWRLKWSYTNYNTLTDILSTDGKFTCSCSVKIQFLREVLEIRKLFLHDFHDITKECLFSVCCPSVLQLKKTIMGFKVAVVKCNENINVQHFTLLLIPVLIQYRHCPIIGDSCHFIRANLLHFELF